MTETAAELRRRIRDLESRLGLAEDIARRTTEYEDIVRDQAQKLEMLDAQVRALRADVAVKDAYLAALNGRKELISPVASTRLIAIKTTLARVPPVYRAAAALRRTVRRWVA